MSQPDPFSEILIKYIEKSGRTQSSVARILGYDRSTVNKWIHGTNLIPFNILRRLCELLEISGADEKDLFLLVGYDVPTTGIQNDIDNLRTWLVENQDTRTLGGAGFSLSIIESFILDPTEPPFLREVALRAYVCDDNKNEAMFVSLLDDPFPMIRRAMLRLVYRNPNPNNEISFDEAVMQQLISATEDYEIAVDAIKATRYEIEQGIIPIQTLIAANRHPYWLVRKLAIEHLTRVGTPNMLELLFEFRNTSYHVSQTLIRKFLEHHFEDDTFSTDQKIMAVSLLVSLIEAKHATPSTQAKDKDLLDRLRVAWDLPAGRP